MGTDGYNITIVVPSGHNVKAYFAYDLAQMMIYTAQHYIKPGNLTSLNIAWQVGTYIHVARQILADAAMSVGSHYTLFIDSDMRFPPDALIKLLLHAKPMVGVNYSSRTTPSRFVAIKKVTGPDGSAGEILRTTREVEGLEEVEALGFGLVLIRQDVFLALPNPEEKPWFWFEWTKGHTGKKIMIGEDVHFCKLVREAGFKILVDHDLSRQVIHIGDHYYSVEHALAFEDEA